MGYSVILGIIIFLFVTFCVAVTPSWAGERLYSMNLYMARLTINHWEDFFIPGEEVTFKDSYLAAATLTRRMGRYENKASFEIEGQVAKHFNIQKHWELNALVSARWEAFWWDDILDTSVAFGFGPSYATEKPEIEIENDGDTSRFLIYWMLELAVSLPDYPSTALIIRIHHRSNAFGLVADEGGSNALAAGVSYRF